MLMFVFFLWSGYNNSGKNHYNDETESKEEETHGEWMERVT